MLGRQQNKNKKSMLLSVELQIKTSNYRFRDILCLQIFCFFPNIDILPANNINKDDIKNMNLIIAHKGNQSYIDIISNKESLKTCRNEHRFTHFYYKSLHI